jgi:signal transduction histidine kinase
MSSLPNDSARQAAAPRLPPSIPSAGADPGQDGELRRALLTALGILDSGPEAAFDGLTLAAAVATGCPVSALSLADGDRLCFKSLHGPQAEQTLDDGRLLGHGLQHGRLLEVTDVLQDARFDSEGWAPGGPSLRYFAGAPVRLEGLPVGVLCVVDTVPRAALDAARREALLGLASAAEALLAARRPGAEGDARALRRRQDLLSRASHEMRTPLNAVLGFTQLLQGEAQLLGDARAAAWVQQIANASGHLLALVDELLELARLEAGRRRMAATRLDLAAVLRDCAQMLAPQAAAQGVALTVSGQQLALDWGVLADERALRQVLINLIGNALQHGPQGHVGDAGTARAGPPARRDGERPRARHRRGRTAAPVPALRAPGQPHTGQRSRAGHQPAARGIDERLHRRRQPARARQQLHGLAACRRDGCPGGPLTTVARRRPTLAGRRYVDCREPCKEIPGHDPTPARRPPACALGRDAVPHLCSRCTDLRATVGGCAAATAGRRAAAAFAAPGAAFGAGAPRGAGAADAGP